MKKNAQWFIFSVLASFLLASGASLGDCIIDEGPYPDEYGFAVFPFYNVCDQDFNISLCVKSVPPGSDTAVFNLLSAGAYGRGPVTITAGKWDAFYSYRWNADRVAECPYAE